MALIDATEAMHLKQLLFDMGAPHQAIEIFNDNISAQNLSKNWIVQNGDIIIHHKPSQEMEADLHQKTTWTKEQSTEDHHRTSSQA